MGLATGWTPVHIETVKLRHQIPEVYGRFFPKALLELDPVEPKATCHACAMAPGRTRTKDTYREDLKCCTFHPWIPNFSVGGILRDPSGKAKAGADVLRGKIARREYALPIGIVAPVRYQVAFNARERGEFGHREDWLCPYYDRATELCVLWRQRGSVCTSYHCKSIHGARGKDFWRRMENYLSYVEMALMEEALVHLDFSPRQVSDLLGYMNRAEGTAAELKSDAMPEKKARELWNGYFDEQEKFFARCADHVAGLDRRSFEAALGEQGEEIEIDLLQALRLWD